MSVKWKAALVERRQRRTRVHGWREVRPVASAQQPFICVAGQWVTNFSSNDYLGLAADVRVVEATRQALSQWGIGSAASHMVTGHSELHEELEQRLARWVGAEKAILFSTGYMANLAVNTTLFEKTDLLLHDKLNHASLIDGARLSSAKLRRFAHLNLDHARRILQQERFARFGLFVDGVFSMDGDVAPLDRIVELVCQHDGLLVVDDAHGLGVLGSCGAGSLSQFGMEPRGTTIMVGTLGKAIGGFGAFVAGDQDFVEELAQSARSYIYTTAMSNATAIGNLAALDVIERNGEQLLAKLRDNITHFRDGCLQLGIPISESNTPIQPLLIGDSKMVVDVSSYLFERGVLVSAIRPPTVRVGSERLRITISAAHTSGQIDHLLECLSDSLRNIRASQKSGLSVGNGCK